MGSSTCQKPIGLHGLVRRFFLLTLFWKKLECGCTITMLYVCLCIPPVNFWMAELHGTCLFRLVSSVRILLTPYLGMLRTSHEQMEWSPVGRQQSIYRESHSVWSVIEFKIGHFRCMSSRLCCYVARHVHSKRGFVWWHWICWSGHPTASTHCMWRDKLPCKYRNSTDSVMRKYLVCVPY
jgi:hypothetical protein